MIPLIEQQLDAIRRICAKYPVRRLELFGSAADGSFNSETSDVDFLVEFKPGTDLGPWLARYFDLRDELRAAVGREVDLVMAGAPKNPHFIREMERTRTPLYAA